MPEQTKKQVFLTVPLKPRVKSALARRAKKSGRNMGREAELIITQSITDQKETPAQ